MTASSLIEMEELSPKHLYLSPNCGKGECPFERTWCEDDQGPCDECGIESVKYVPATARAREGWTLIDYDNPPKRDVLLYFPQTADRNGRNFLPEMKRVGYVGSTPNRRPTHYAELMEAPPVSTPERG